MDADSLRKPDGRGILYTCIKGQAQPHYYSLLYPIRPSSPSCCLFKKDRSLPAHNGGSRANRRVGPLSKRGRLFTAFVLYSICLCVFAGSTLDDNVHERLALLYTDCDNYMLGDPAAGRQAFDSFKLNSIDWSYFLRHRKIQKYKKKKKKKKKSDERICREWSGETSSPCEDDKLFEIEILLAPPSSMYRSRFPNTTREGGERTWEWEGSWGGESRDLSTLWVVTYRSKLAH